MTESCTSSARSRDRNDVVLRVLHSCYNHERDGGTSSLRNSVDCSSIIPSISSNRHLLHENSSKSSVALHSTRPSGESGYLTEATAVRPLDELY